MRYHNLLTLAVSFALSMGAYFAAHIDDVPVQHLEFEEFEIEPRIEVIEFEEYLIVSQSDEADDGDSENLDMMNAHWCDIWPDDAECVNNDKEEDDKEGC